MALRHLGVKAVHGGVELTFLLYSTNPPRAHIQAEELFGLSIPMVSVGAEAFDAIADAAYVSVAGG